MLGSVVLAGSLLDESIHHLVLLERFLIWVLLPRLREEHDPHLVLPLDPPSACCKSLDISAGVLVSAHKLVVHLVRLAWFASLPYLPERRGQIEGHDHLLGNVLGDVLVSL